MNGKFGLIVIPFIVSSKQAVQRAIQHVVHEQGLINQDTGHIRLSDCHCVIGVCAHRVPVVDGAPLLTCEVQGFISGGRTSGFGFSRSFRRSFAHSLRAFFSRSGAGRGAFGGGSGSVTAAGSEACGHRDCKKHGQQRFFSHFHKYSSNLTKCRLVLLWDIYMHVLLKIG